jgi:rod shape-determining protein MreC
MAIKQQLFSNDKPKLLGWLACLICCALGLMLLDKYVPSTIMLHRALAITLLPLRYLVNEPQNLLANLSQVFSTRDALLQENQALRTEQLLLKGQLQRLQGLESDNNNLQGLVQVAHNLHNKMLIAKALSANSELGLQQLVLNKGSAHGVYVGQPVLDAYGVMGQVIAMDKFSSRVLLLNSQNSGIAIESIRNGIRSVAVGDGYSSYLYVTNIPQTADIRLGDLFVTSGLSDRYPQGYPVGRVALIENEPGLPFSAIKLAAIAHLHQSRQLLLVSAQQHD